jgi:hypothetical protein
VSEPAEALPPGSREAVLLCLYRDAVTWALRAEANAGPERTLAELWGAVSPARLTAAAGGDASRDAVHELLTKLPEAGSLDARDGSVALARSFSEALLRELDAPERNLSRIERQRYTRLGLLVVAVGALVLGAAHLLRGPDLAAKRPFELSSVYQGCNAPGKCAELMFHTEREEKPWATIDLGSSKTVSSVEVKNRTDCCSERAIPLVVELSTDNRNFSEVARRDADFAFWEPRFKAQQARYVRLRSLQTTALHLKGIVIR